MGSVACIELELDTLKTKSDNSFSLPLSLNDRSANRVHPEKITQ